MGNEGGTERGREGGGGMREGRYERGREGGWFLPQSLLSCMTSSDWLVCGVSSGGGWEARYACEGLRGL